nr:discoidin domain-containing protein [uncultured Carboxylicivirga sp.]
MKQFSFYSIVLLNIIFLVSCDKNFEALEIENGSGGHLSTVSNITSEPLPGQIALKWDIPADSAFHLLQISYHDFLTDEDVSLVKSVYTDSILIDNTREKFGKYTFYFQTYDATGNGGDISSFEAVSGRAPITETITATKINLTANQLSTDNQEPSEGPIENLIDDDPNTFFHTRWSSPQIPMPQYIQVDLDEPIDDFQFYQLNRNGSQQAPRLVDIQISNDGENWETIANLTAGLPSGSQAEYTSDVFRPGKTFTHFRYVCLETFDNRNYFNLAEFQLFDVTIDIYDPEL